MSGKERAIILVVVKPSEVLSLSYEFVLKKLVLDRARIQKDRRFFPMLAWYTVKNLYKQKE